jgi:protein involved in polysaccharide export with SLBB domain
MKPIPTFRPLAILATLSLLLTACSGTIGSFPAESAPPTIANPTEGYLLEPGNRVRITVFNEPNLTGDFSVDSAGNIALPLIGNVPASGITAKALAHRIEENLKRGDFLQSPNVATEIQTFRPFYVLGEVRQGGEFQYSTGMTVLSGIARAGGYDYRAVTGEVVLVRIVDGKQKEYRATEETPILPGDIIKVLERRF